MFQPQAAIIADSINLTGDRLTTFVLIYHRMIHSEFMTHRMLSKNSSSNRAIPVEKMIKLVEEQEVYPLHWGKNQKGMTAKEQITDIDKAREVWGEARQDAIKHAKRLVEIGVHKQVVNRLLEPFSSITVICTGTEYQNFFDQRCHPDAQPEIQALANAMKTEYDASEPKRLKAGEWHIPFVKFVYHQGITEYYDNGVTHEELLDDKKSLDKILKIAVGRCARVSYNNHDGKRDIQSDIALHDRLLRSKPAHLSPFEHIAIALSNSEKRANLTGWQSYRNILEQKHD